MTLIGKIKSKAGNYFKKWKEGIQDFAYLNKISHTNERSLLIIKIDSIGDYIIFRNFLKGIRKSAKFRNHRITLLGNIWYKEIAERFDKDSIDEFIWVDLHRLKEPQNFNLLVKRIFRQGFEHAVSPNYSPAAEDVKLLGRSGARFKYMQKGDTINVSEDIKKKYQTGMSVIDIGSRHDFEFYRYTSFLERFLEEDVLTKDSVLELPVNEDKKIIICPGANSVLRMWPAKNFAKLIEYISAEHASHSFILIGSPNEKQLGEEILLCCNNKNVLNKIGKLNPEQVAEEIAGAALVITNDTGPYHISMALRKKTVCISNGNNYGRFTPYPSQFRRNSVTVISEKLEQMIQDPAWVIKLQSEVSREKISDISVDKVYKTVKELMS